MHYADLTPYTYTAGARPGAVNVGWLAAGQAYHRGKVSAAVRDSLVRLAREPEAVMRGLHNCELCDAESPLRVDDPHGADRPVWLGTGEIRVSNGAVAFHAPTLVIHYIDQHGYCPPEAFLRALERT